MPAVLESGHDFDDVVLGVAFGALPYVAADLADHSASWRELLQRVPTVPTQSVQLWFDPPTHALGWPHGPAIHGAAGHIGSWEDMSPVAAREAWIDPPQTVLYGVRHAQRADDEASIAADLDTWRAESLSTWLPGAEVPRAIYVHGNHEPEARYVQALPGTARYRLPPGRAGFDNLVLCGAWTRTGFHIACIESAVMSGLMACRALTGSPARIVGEPHQGLDE